ncbi:hypothetical protein [Epilithonimonas vandammei]|nr:hypothetical protein [Epilithonimonas vandammei]
MAEPEELDNTIAIFDSSEAQYITRYNIFVDGDAATSQMKNFCGRCIGEF